MLRHLARLVRRPGVLTIDGLSLIANDAALSACVRLRLHRELYEHAVRRAVRSLLDSTDRVLELGTGIGFVALECIRICGAENILCYEPNARIASLARRNLELNGWKPTLRQRAMTADGRDVELYVSRRVMGSSILARRRGMPTRVHSDSISSVIRDFRPTALVMDVEGAEIELLEAAPLGDVRKLTVEIHPHLVGEEAVSEMIRRLERRGLVLRPSLCDPKTRSFERIAAGA